MPTYAQSRISELIRERECKELRRSAPFYLFFSIAVLVVWGIKVWICLEAGHNAAALFAQYRAAVMEQVWGLAFLLIETYAGFFVALMLSTMIWRRVVYKAIAGPDAALELLEFVAGETDTGGYVVIAFLTLPALFLVARRAASGGNLLSLINDMQWVLLAFVTACCGYSFYKAFERSHAVSLGYGLRLQFGFPPTLLAVLILLTAEMLLLFGVGKALAPVLVSRGTEITARARARISAAEARDASAEAYKRELLQKFDTNWDSEIQALSRGSSTRINAVQVTARQAGMRREPSWKSELVRLLPNGTPVTVLTEKGAWSKIRAGASEGWTFSKSIGRTRRSQSGEAAFYGFLAAVIRVISLILIVAGFFSVVCPTVVRAFGFSLSWALFTGFLGTCLSNWIAQWLAADYNVKDPWSLVALVAGTLGAALLTLVLTRDRCQVRGLGAGSSFRARPVRW